MRKIFLLLTLLISGMGFSQDKTINDYKYVIVPDKFEFLSDVNKYNMNTLTKMVFEKYGFQVYHPNEKMPDELALDKCKALYGNVEDDSGLLSVGLFITLKDCNGKEMFRSKEGKSKIKQYQRAYYEALRDASQSLAGLNYHYSGKNIVEKANDIKGTDSHSTISPSEGTVAKVETANNDAQLFAQPITNGFQLVDSTPKVVLKIYRTSQPDNYTAQGEGKSGVVFKKGSDWIFEYYKNDNLVSEKLNIKF